MINNEVIVSENYLRHKVGSTLYEIIVKQSDNAEESVDDILARLIATDPKFNSQEVDANG